MSAIAAIASVRPKEIAAALNPILAVADNGSVIAKDKAMAILAQLAAAGEKKAMPALLDRLERAAPSQFPLYCELALPALSAAHRGRFLAILEERLKAINAPAKRARVDKVLRKLAAGPL